MRLGCGVLLLLIIKLGIYPNNNNDLCKDLEKEQTRAHTRNDRRGSFINTL